MAAQLRNPLSSSFLRRAGELRRVGTLCDAVVTVDGQAFPAHSLVLACASRELERRLTVAKDDGRHSHRRCAVDALSARTFRQVLDYTYADVLEVPVDDLPGLLEAARVLEMEELEKQCLAWLETMNSEAGGGGRRGRRSSGPIGGEPESPEAESLSPGSADLEAFPQVHDSIYSYARFLHPFHHSLLQGPQKLALSVKHGPLGKKALVDAALMDNMRDGAERKHQGTADGVFRCLHCRKEFLDPRQLQTHAVTSSVPLEPPFCPFCGKDQDSGGHAAHLPPHTRKWGHLCSDCGRSFASSTALRRHQRQHTGEVSLHCEYCDRCFRDESSLRSHRRIHSGEKPYQCQRCPKRFSLKHQLDTHYRVHTGEKPFECRLCGQRSRDYSAMIKHLRTHGGATPYQCTICLEYCSSLAAMQKHLKSHPVQDFPPDWSIGSTYLYTSHS
ncbi:hypothetical protein SKAU_G00417090 [Synaphobranchus kaupii]|uniref:Uncharacterized protein n=1 Tax=Synaphobranchus kaupii TaxID=118154 RepID=A0A9Q1E5X2_SYNKA|nr:hypothetical protein SKAU_G00417090 [Synaphobranchus kaupii]